MAKAKKSDKEKKGVVGKYNKQSVTKRKYYYDYNDVSNVEKGFADSFSELETFNTKLKDELKKEKTVKLKIHDDEALKESLERASWINNEKEAQTEYEKYQKAGGQGDFKTFIKTTLDLVKAGEVLKSGADVVGGNVRLGRRGMGQ